MLSVVGILVRLADAYALFRVEFHHKRSLKSAKPKHLRPPSRNHNGFAGLSQLFSVRDRDRASSAVPKSHTRSKLIGPRI